MLERIRKAHEILLQLENIRHTLVTIGTIANPHLTEAYEAELMGKLEETEALLGKVSECLHRKSTTPALSQDALREV